MDENNKQVKIEERLKTHNASVQVKGPLSVTFKPDGTLNSKTVILTITSEDRDGDLCVWVWKSGKTEYGHEMMRCP